MDAAEERDVPHRQGPGQLDGALRGGEQLTQAHAIHELHGDEQAAVIGLVEIVDVHGVGVAQAAGRFGFITESGDELGIPGELRVHQLECTDFVQSHVGGFKNGTHPPAPDFGDDEVLVVGDHLPWLPLFGLDQPRVVAGASGVFVRVFTKANWA